MQTQYFSSIYELAAAGFDSSSSAVSVAAASLTGASPAGPELAAVGAGGSSLNGTVVASSITVASGITTDPVPVPNSSEDTSLQEGISAGAGILLLIGVFLMLRRASFRRKAEGSTRNALENNRSPIPCQDCRYFHPNTFLPCAVNPALALRKEAADCTDFCPRHGEPVSKSVHS